MGIGDDIFTATMRFCTRFMEEHKKIYGDYAFEWAWWFPRQLALSVDYESMAVLDWVYPGEKKDFAALSDHTTLQKNKKRFLLNGGKVGWAEGKLRGEYT